MNGCSQRLTVVIAAVATFGCAMAQSRTGIEAIRDAGQPLRRVRDAVCASGPATMVCLDPVSLSAITLSADYDRQSRAVIGQLGRGEHDMSVSAESYTHLDTASCVWGSAGFRTGVTRDVRWTDCVDYLRVAPYVLGDGVGGDLSSREYRFAGGYGREFGRWTLGAGAAYRAEIAYRDRDPRVKTVVSDLDITLGGAYAVSPRYTVGVDAAIGIYRQNCDLDFYNPVNDVNTYPLTGLGTYYKRFMGNNNKNSGYQADSYSAGVQFVSRDGYGLNAALGYTHSRMEQRLRNYNNLTLGITDTDRLGVLLTYVLRLSSTVRFAPSADVTLDSRKGTENLFGTSSGASYEIIGNRSNYRQTYNSAVVSLPIELTHGTSVFTATPRFALTSISARVIDVDRKLDVNGVAPGVELDYSKVTSSSLLIRAGIGCDYTFTAAPAAKNNILAQASSIDIDGLGECLVSNFENLRSDKISTGVTAEVGKMIGGILYSVRLSYRYLGITDTRVSCHTAGVTLAATF